LDAGFLTEHVNIPNETVTFGRNELYLGLVIYERGRAGVDFVRRGTIPLECLDYSSKLSDDTGTAESAERNPASPIGKAFAFGPE